MDRESPGIWIGGAALATLGIAGSVLTFGLIRPWGEVFPRWIPVLRGRRVPIPVAVVPAAVVALLVTSAGLMLSRVLFTRPAVENWVAMGPAMLWPLWGAALAAAALAYYYRRRGACPRCGPGAGGVWTCERGSWRGGVWTEERSDEGRRRVQRRATERTRVTAIFAGPL